MTAEELWYTASRNGQPPHCKRMSRQPLAEQWEAIIDLAIEITMGHALWRHATISLTSERYWFFRANWWLLTDRMERRARLIIDAATTAEVGRASEAGSAIVDTSNIAALLERWKVSGRWKKLAARIPSTHRNAPPKMRGRGKKNLT